MSTIHELGAFVAREMAASSTVVPHLPELAVATNGAALRKRRGTSRTES